MRFLLVLAASSVLAYLLAQLLHVRAPRGLEFYVGWNFLCTSLAYFALQHIPRTEKSYANFFIVTMAPAAALALSMAVQFILPLGLRHGGRLFVFGALFFASLFCMLREHLPETRQAEIILAQGYLFCLAGILTLVSLAAPHPPLGFWLRVALGLYWLSIGAYSFCLAIGLVRSRALWESVNGWLPSAAAIVVLLPLAIWLSGRQPESARQHVTDEAVTELQWEVL